MAATYVPDFNFARDRVRTEVFDVAAPFRFSDEVIAYRLAQNGFVGDPAASTTLQAIPELLAEIALIESVPDVSSGTNGASVTIKQGSWSRTSSDGSLGGYDRTTILASLKRRLNSLYAIQSGDYGGPSVVDPYEGRRCL